jgi:hypothetical protein
MLAEDEGIDEQILREELLEGRSRDRDDEIKIRKVPLASRHTVSRIRNRRPVARWFADYFAGRKKASDPLEFTSEELWKDLEKEGLDE